jgi:hypothetical protein
MLSARRIIVGGKRARSKAQLTAKATAPWGKMFVYKALKRLTCKIHQSISSNECSRSYCKICISSKNISSYTQTVPERLECNLLSCFCLRSTQYDSELVSLIPAGVRLCSKCVCLQSPFCANSAPFPCTLALHVAEWCTSTCTQICTMHRQLPPKKYFEKEKDLVQ